MKAKEIYSIVMIYFSILPNVLQFYINEPYSSQNIAVFCANVVETQVEM